MVGAYSFTTDESELSLLQLANWVRMNVKDHLARLNGMNDTEIFGERNDSMRIWLDPLKLSKMGSSTGEAVAAIQSQKSKPRSDRLAASSRANSFNSGSTRSGASRPRNGSATLPSEQARGAPGCLGRNRPA